MRSYECASMSLLCLQVPCICMYVCVCVRICACVWRDLATAIARKQTLLTTAFRLLRTTALLSTPAAAALLLACLTFIFFRNLL